MNRWTRKFIYMGLGTAASFLSYMVATLLIEYFEGVEDE